MPERTEDAQIEALRAFLLLCALGSEWQGRLVLVRGLDAQGRAMSRAAALAGAACLTVEARAEVCRATLRASACDFVVNSVDEALRILKNEIRQRRPVCVALSAPEDAAFEELAARGVAPDVFVGPTEHDAAPAGARFGAFGGAVVSSQDSERLVDEYMAAHGLTMREFRFGSVQELSEFDRHLGSAVPNSELRRRWAVAAPGFFYRERPWRRVAALTATESSGLGDTPSPPSSKYSGL
jgi:hypothetical protein